MAVSSFCLFVSLESFVCSVLPHQLFTMSIHRTATGAQKPMKNISPPFVLKHTRIPDTLAVFKRWEFGRLLEARRAYIDGDLYLKPLHLHQVAHILNCKASELHVKVLFTMLKDKKNSQACGLKLLTLLALLSQGDIRSRMKVNEGIIIFFIHLRSFHNSAL